MCSAYKLNKWGDYAALMYSFSYLEPVCYSMSSSNYCFLSCIQIFKEAGQVIWYSHLLKNFPQFAVIHTVKDFSIVNEAEVDVFLKFSCFAIHSSRGSSWFRNQTFISYIYCIGRQVLYHKCHLRSHTELGWTLIQCDVYSYKKRKDIDTEERWTCKDRGTDWSYSTIT